MNRWYVWLWMGNMGFNPGRRLNIAGKQIFYPKPVIWNSR